MRDADDGKSGRAVEPILQALRASPGAIPLCRPRDGLPPEVDRGYERLARADLIARAVQSPEP